MRRGLRMNVISSDTEAEVLVLRHELAVLRRQIKRPKLRQRDKLFLAAMSRMLPRECWAAFIVTPGHARAMGAGTDLEEQDVEGGKERRLHGEEVTGEDPARLRSEEL